MASVFLQVALTDEEKLRLAALTREGMGLVDVEFEIISLKKTLSAECTDQGIILLRI